MKHCYLHLGFHKTGTTSCQLTVRKNSNLLEEQGIILPQFHGKNNKISANHSGQIRKLFHAKTRNLSSQESISQYQKEFSKLLKEDRHILLSGEGISTLPKKSIESLVDEIAKHGFMVKPFALVRSPYAYLNSALQQTIKNGQHHELIRFGRQCLTASEITSKLPNTLKSIQTLIEAEDSDIFDVLEHIAYSKKPIQRATRVANAENKIYKDLNEKQKEFIDFVLSKYVQGGVEELDINRLSSLVELKYKSLHDGQKALGDADKIKSTISAAVAVATVFTALM